MRTSSSQPPPAPIGTAELRELHPVALILEALAVRHARPYDADALGALRGANARLRAAGEEPAGAARAEHEFHRLLTGHSDDERLLALLAPVRAALRRHTRSALAGAPAASVHRQADEHEAIIAALEHGDHEAASVLVREHLAGALSELLARVERRAAP